MSIVNAARNCVLAAMVTSTSACSFVDNSQHFEEQQLAALQRWNSCIERQVDYYQGPILEVYNNVSAQCEGHQRDVLATYPEHLENQVDAMLSQRATSLTTGHLLRSSDVEQWQKTASENFSRLKLKTKGAQVEDL